MLRNPDPKPGRWLLPIVVVAMVGFTWVFVNTVDQGSVPGATTPPDNGGTATTSTTSTTSVGEPPTDQTTTTLAPAVQAYLTTLDALQVRADTLLETGRDINLQWDEREIDFATAVDQMTTLADDTQTLADDFEAATPSELAHLQAAHIEATIAARAMAQAAANMLTGLRDEAGSAGRLAALDEFQTAAAELAVAVEVIKIEAEGGPPPETTTTTTTPGEDE